jgi:hypothetical protein
MKSKDELIKEVWVGEIIRRITTYKMTKALEKVLNKLEIGDLKTIYGYI